MILGGTQDQVLLLCEGLCRRGHEVTLVAGPMALANGLCMQWVKYGEGIRQKALGNRGKGKRYKT